MENKIDQLSKILSESNNIVFFGGAGVSTDLEFLISEALMDYLMKNLI